MQSDKFVDAKGLSCPMPIVQAKKGIDGIESGQILELHTTDAGSKNDIAGWVSSTGHELLEQKEEEGIFKFWIRKK